LWQSILRQQKGSTVVLVALAAVALFGFAALVVDAGLLYLASGRLNNMVDAAALAAARDLIPALATGDPVTTAEKVAVLNGKEAGDQLYVSVTNGQVTVTAVRRVELFLAPVLGFSASNVQATASATAGVLASATGVVPFGVEKQNFSYGDTYVLKAGGGDGTTGNYGGLALGDKGANVYEFNIQNGYSGVLHIGDMVSTQTGNMSGPTNDGVSSRISQDSAGSFPPQNFESPRIITVPVIDSLDVNGTKPVQIVGFANFYLESVGGSGSDCYVTGRFIKLPRDGDISSSATFYGAYNVKLVK